VRDLLAAEWRRFRRHALAAAVCHGLVLLFLSQVTSVLQLSCDSQALMLAIYMLLGLALALVQVGGYRKPSQWMWLMHRPLAPTRIFAALALSALAMLALAVFVPLLLFVIATDTLTTHVVDTRHYIVLLHVLAFTMMAWLAGAQAIASGKKVMVAVLIAPFLLAMHLASVWPLLLPVAVCLAWLTGIALHAFRADRFAPIARPAVLLLTALPLQLAFFLLVFHLSKVVLGAAELLAQGNQPAETVLASDANAAAWGRSFSQQFIIKGLENSPSPRAAEWREQIPLLTVAGFAPEVSRFPVRHQISNLNSSWWDARRGIEWTFSHDRMMFHGRDPRTGADRGWWSAAGSGEETAFGQIPLSGMTAGALFGVDDDARRQHELVRLPPGERFVSRPQRALGRTFVLTTKRLLAYRDDEETISRSAPLVLDWEVGWTGQAETAPAVDIVELMDGWLVSLFHFSPGEFDGYESLFVPWQQVFHVDGSGRAHVVGTRTHIRDHDIIVGGAPLVPRASWWVSPILYTVARWPGSALDKGLTQPAPLAPWPPAPAFYPLAAASMLVSFGLGSWWLRGAAMKPGRRRVWLASCLVLGLPAFLSLACMEPRGARV
jgi:hypothetical protein